MSNEKVNHMEFELARWIGKFGNLSQMAMATLANKKWTSLDDSQRELVNYLAANGDVEIIDGVVVAIADERIISFE